MPRISHQIDRMDVPHPDSTPLGPNDVTLDADQSWSSESVRSPAQRVRLVEGSGGELTRETRLVLRSRLRIAALVLAMGFAVFILWRLIAAAVDVAAPPIDGTFYGQVVVFLVLLSCAMPLCRTCEVGSRALRAEELLIFGSPAVFFFALQFTVMRECAVRDNMLPRPDAPWLMLMFTYAMFIPNTWRRAAIAIGAMAVAPLRLDRGALGDRSDLRRVDCESDWWTMVPGRLDHDRQRRGGRDRRVHDQCSANRSL